MIRPFERPGDGRVVTLSGTNVTAEHGYALSTDRPVVSGVYGGQNRRPMDEFFWDNSLQRFGGNLLQSWRWGCFKERQGWQVERLHDEDPSGAWMAQILFKHMGPVSIAYIPCGPTLIGDHDVLFPSMMAEIDDACKRHRAISLIMEPNLRFKLQGTFKDHGFVQWTNPFQPRETISIPVSDDESMLAKMHHKTRYHIRLAERQGIETKACPVNDETIAQFYALHAETVDRMRLTLLPVDYFKDLLEVFDDRAALIFSIAADQVAAGALMVRFGSEASYLFAGSSKQVRGQAAGASLIFGSLQWARDYSCQHVDLGSVVSDGLREFKSGFGGVIHSFPTPMERRFHPLPAWCARRVLTSRTF